jgi:GNAT superfamily N-acetyltransferase
VAGPAVVFVVPARDGTGLHFRPVVPSDRSQLVTGFSELSAESRFRRFGTLYERLTDEQLSFLRDLDYQQRFAWGVLVGDPPDVGVAIGRYARYAGDAVGGGVVADVGITVADQWQGRGIGTALLEALAITADVNGIKAFETLVLAENEPMLEIFRRYGAEISPVELGSVEVTLPLRPVVERLGDHPLARLLDWD